MAAPAARAVERDAARETLVVLGFVYPDALDIRTRLAHDSGHLPVRALEDEPPQSVSRSQPPGAERAPVGGTE